MKRNKIQFFLVVIFFATVHSSCSKKKGINTVAEYISVVQNPENGLSTSKKIEDFEFSVLYKPLDYIIALENKDNKVSKDSINKRKQQLEGYQYYTKDPSVNGVFFKQTSISRVLFDPALCSS